MGVGLSLGVGVLLGFDKLVGARLQSLLLKPLQVKVNDVKPDGQSDGRQIVRWAGVRRTCLRYLSCPPLFDQSKPWQTPDDVEPVWPTIHARRSELLWNNAPKSLFGTGTGRLPVTRTLSEQSTGDLMADALDAPRWQQDIFAALKQARISQIGYVPDAGHAHLIRSAIADPAIADVVLTTEEEGVALSCGAWLGGQRCALLMQSSGVGNCINMFSLLQSADFPFFTLVTMRGEFAEFNPWQVPMGQATPGALALMGLQVMRIEHADEAGNVVSAGLDAAFESGAKIAVLLSQRLIGRKQWGRK